mmetsp:Transcript_47601/g.126228  ORF Transcript_47601/g.126228 Transcript_47601/m.126228 type:complete len:278 (-) Transcript_47601:12-845(-)
MASAAPQIIESRSVTASGSTVYESSKAVDEYLQFHFAGEDEYAPLVKSFVCKESMQFPALCANECVTEASNNGRALDIGCAVGGSSFELARKFTEVVGIDFSNAFVKAASDMQTNGSMTYESTIEGLTKEQRVAKVDPSIDRSRCKFLVGDACDLPSLKLGQFDAVLAANLLCRVPNPAKFLRDVRDVVKEGGVFVIISPYSWLKEYTDQSQWIGGYDGEGGPVWSADRLRAILGGPEGGFDLVGEKEMPFLIREHRRKYQIGVSHRMVWKRRAAGA